MFEYKDTISAVATPAHKAVMNTAILAHQPLVLKLAKKAYYRFGRKYEFDDLVGYGNVGLVMAARQYNFSACQYDLAHAIDFEDFAAKRIFSHMKLGRDKMSTLNRKQHDRVRRGEMSAPRFEHDSDQYTLADAIDSGFRSPSSDAEFRDEVEAKLAIIRAQYPDPRVADMVRARLQGQTYRQAAKSVHITAKVGIEKCQQAFGMLVAGNA